MPGHYDALETRDPAVREREQFARLPGHHRARHELHQAGRSISRASIRNRSRRVLHWRSCRFCASRKFPHCKKADPPFGGLNVTAPGKARRLLMSPGPIFEPEGEGTDWYGAARALYAAGFRSGDVVHNSFAYHLTPGGFILESGCSRAWLRRHSRRCRKYRTAARGHRSLPAIRLCRHAGLPQDPA